MAKDDRGLPVRDGDPLREVVLVGLGHAHLFVGAGADRFRRAGLNLTLIDDGEFWYSSIGSGLLGGRYERADDVIDAEAFAAEHSIRFVRGRATAIDPAARTITLEGGNSVSYDLVSLNVGSRTDPPFPVSGTVWRPKPVSGLLDFREALINDMKRKDGSLRLVTVGGNHSGCELTLNALSLARRHGATVDATMLTSGKELIANEPAGARRAMRTILTEAGCTVRTGTRVASIANGTVQLVDGTSVAFDHALVATGLSAALLIAKVGLPHDERGLHVTDRLHSVADDRVFAAGDCTAIEGHDLPKVGVFGVRAAPVLARNLLARAEGTPLKAYRPQRVWFAAQNLGDGTGLASWGPFWWRGRTALALKDWNDRRFMNRYRPYSQPAGRSFRTAFTS